MIIWTSGLLMPMPKAIVATMTSAWLEMKAFWLRVRSGPDIPA